MPVRLPRLLPTLLAGLLVLTAAGCEQVTAPGRPPTERPEPPQPAPAPEPEPEPPGEPDPDPEPSAFERRAALRAERHQLVASLRRLDGRSHAEINGAVNRTLGIRSVDKATIAELEKSIALLNKELEKTSRRRRTRRAAAAR